MEWLTAEKLAEEEHYDWNGYYRGEHTGYEELVSYRSVAAGSVHHDGDGSYGWGGTLYHYDEGNAKRWGNCHKYCKKAEREQDVLAYDELDNVLNIKGFCCLQVYVNVATDNDHYQGNGHGAYAAKYVNHESWDKDMCPC